MGAGLSSLSSFPMTSMSQYPSGMPQPNDCHQMSSYELMAAQSHHHSFASSFNNHSSINAHHSAAQGIHGMSFSDYGKQSEEYAKAMQSSEGHFPKAAPATAPNPSASAMIDCYAKLGVPEANNNWNHQSYGASAPSASNAGSSYSALHPTGSAATPNGNNSLCHVPPGVDYSAHQYGINIGHNF